MSDLGQLDADEFRAALADATDDEIIELVGELPDSVVISLVASPESIANLDRPVRVPLEHQRPPEGDWRGWLLLGGRGAGKTFAGMSWLADQARQRPGLRGRVIAPTFADAVASCVEGPSGLLLLDPSARFIPGRPGGARVEWPNGATVWLLGTPTVKDTDRLRALTNIDVDVFEEAAANPQLAGAVDQARLSRRRVGARWVATTTPRPLKTIRGWKEDPRVAITAATSHDNPHVDPEWLTELEDIYAGTRLYRQEVLGLVIDDVEGALWQLSVIEASQFKAFDRTDPWRSLALGLATTNEHFGRGAEMFTNERRRWQTVIGVDPPGETAECGIVAVTAPKPGRWKDHAVVLADRSLAGPPEKWGAAAVALYHELDADLIIVERNYGGPMALSTIRNIDPTVNVKPVNAEGSKQDRAEPVSVLYAKGRIHHLGHLPLLEDQQTTWVPAEKKSPDRIDALVHALNQVLPPPRISRASAPDQRKVASTQL